MEPVLPPKALTEVLFRNSLSALCLNRVLLPVTVAIMVSVPFLTLLLPIVLRTRSGRMFPVILVSIGARLVTFALVLPHGLIVRLHSFVILPGASVLLPGLIFVFIFCFLILCLSSVAALL